MCLIRMAPSHEFAMDRNKFLRTAQRKRSINKKKPEPDMRVEALLEATCKRLRQELKVERKRIAEDGVQSSKRFKYDYSSDEDSDSSDSDVDLDESDADCNEQGSEDDQPSMCSVRSRRICDEPNNLSDLNIAPGSFPQLANTAVADLRLEKKSVCLWDDPQQVEDFFRQVETDHDPEKNYSGNLDLDKELFNPLRTCPEGILATCVPSCDLNSFTSEFDSLYREMFQKLSAVESMVTQQQNSLVIAVVNS